MVYILRIFQDELSARLENTCIYWQLKNNPAQSYIGQCMKISTLKLISIFIISLMAVASTQDASVKKKKIDLERSEKLPDSATGYDWEQVASEQLALSSEDIQNIKINNVLITNDAFKQVFDPYISTSVPVFITSDAVLFAYHVLLEESLIRLENKNSNELSKILKGIWDALPYQNTDLSNKILENDSKLRDQIIIGTALRLLGIKIASSNEYLLKIIAEETENVVKASLFQKPQWLGKPDSCFVAIDYSRFKPRGMYTRTPELMNYFRAISWLQSIPFRIEKDEELVSILILGSAFYSINKETTNFRRADNADLPDYSEFIGAADAWNLNDAAREIQGNLHLYNEDDLGKMRIRLWRSAAKDYSYKTDTINKFLINDQIRFYSSLTGKPEAHFRIISVFQSFDAILYHQLENSGLPISSISVPSVFDKQFARSIYDSLSAKPTSLILDSCSKFFAAKSIYSSYLEVLQTLISNPEPDVPSFMLKKSWKLKSLNSFLIGYSLFKHATVLHSKENAFYLGASRIPPGFVEPNPEFWSRFGYLCLETKEFFEKKNIFSYNYPELKDEIKMAISLLDNPDFYKCLISGKRCRMSTVNDNLAQDIKELTAVDWWYDDVKGGKPAVIDSLKKLLNGMILTIDSGNMEKSEYLVLLMDSKYKNLMDDWKHLEETSKELEMLTHKQLRKRQFNKEENNFFRHFGVFLGGIMQYKGNSYLTPIDDSPRITDIISNPNQKKYLEIGTCRPRALYVLYPWNGIDILCRGAVLPFYEFWSPERLDDKTWLELLDSPRRPKVPDYLKDIYSGKRLSKPKFEQID
jgi:hypothetical protein